MGRRVGLVAAVVRLLLAATMVVAGVGHFVAHEEFLGQTPAWLPARSLIVWVTGVMEIALGIALLVVHRHRRWVGWAVALFLVAVFPGNVYQAVAGTDAFGLDTPAARLLRLTLQPLLVVAALWCTGAWPRGGATGSAPSRSAPSRSRP
jgi:uncharacterized membrane protein